MPTLDVGPHRISFRERGEGRPALLLVHGAAASSLYFCELLNLLGRQRRVVALDLPGHGSSSLFRPLPPPETLLEVYRDVIAELAERLGLGRFVLIGHSMGGAVAQLFALAYPERLQALVLLATGARLPVAPQLLQVVANQFDRLPELVASTAYSPVTSPEQALRGATLQLQASQEVALADFRACNLFDVRDQLERIETPTTIISAADDRLTPPRVQQRLAERLRLKRLHTLTRAGHCAHVERPDEVARLILEF